MADDSSAYRRINKAMHITRIESRTDTCGDINVRRRFDEQPSQVLIDAFDAEITFESLSYFTRQPAPDVLTLLPFSYYYTAAIKNSLQFIEL